MATKNIQCKYFAQGCCARGNSCYYAHTLDAKRDNVCKFYIAGNCAYGKACRYDHVRQKKQPNPVTVPAPRPTQPIQAQVEEKRKLKLVPFREETSEAIANTSEAPASQRLDGVLYSTAIKPEDGESEETHAENVTYVITNPPNAPKVAIDLSSKQKIDASRGVSCSICLENVLELANLSDRRFGILPNCNHAFCLGCIRNWRRTSGQGKEVRKCPTCRVESYFVVPSAYWVTDEEEKTQLVNAYRDESKKIDCKHFNFGDGNCPFGSSCFYAHRDKDGEEVREEVRFRAGPDERVLPTPNVRITDFLLAREGLS
eukprot:m.82137 g.82137  ORF g.82137 m.82137 type:complete len:315 (-) comp12855_c0_seq1:2779-3723(-)